MIEIEQILDKVKWPRKNGGLSCKELIEDKIGFDLPADYVFFLSNYSGYETFINENYFVLWDEKELISLNESYEVQFYLPNLLAIGSNGGGEMVGLETKGNNNYRIILIPFGSMAETEQHIIIGNSFINFLHRMNDGEKWFNGIPNKL